MTLTQGRALQRPLDAIDNHGSGARRKQTRKPLGSGAFGVIDAQPGDVEVRKCESDRLADATSADERHGTATGLAQQRRDRALKARGVRIVPDQPAVAHNDGIDGAHRRRLRCEFVEQFDHGFLVGVGHIDTGEAQPAHAFEQRRKARPVGTGDLDQLIVAADAERRRSVFVHRGRRRMRDRCTDQAGQEFAGFERGKIRHVRFSLCCRLARSPHER